jgi:hypothetical protein
MYRGISYGITTIFKKRIDISMNHEFLIFSIVDVEMYTNVHGWVSS